MYMNVTRVALQLLFQYSSCPQIVIVEGTIFYVRLRVQNFSGRLIPRRELNPLYL